MAIQGLTKWNTEIRVSDLKNNLEHAFLLTPSPTQMNALAGEMGISSLKKMRFKGVIKPVGDKDWQIIAHLGASVVQPCVTTLVPVGTRLETDITRTFIADHTEEFAPDEEVEIPEDDTVDPLPILLNISNLACEALAMALPDYPRAADAELSVTQFSEPGKDAMTDDDAKPFASLKALRDNLQKDE